MGYTRFLGEFFTSKESKYAIVDYFGEFFIVVILDLGEFKLRASWINISRKRCYFHRILKTLGNTCLAVEWCQHIQYIGMGEARRHPEGHEYKSLPIWKCVSAVEPSAELYKEGRSYSWCDFLWGYNIFLGFKRNRSWRWYPNVLQYLRIVHQQETYQVEKHDRLHSVRTSMIISMRSS